MTVKRYRDVADMPPAILGDEDMTAAEGLRLACELSVTAQRLAGSTAPGSGVRLHPSLGAGTRPRDPGGHIVESTQRIK